MPTFIILILVTLIFYFCLIKVLNRSFLQAENNCKFTRKEYEKVFSASEKLKEENMVLHDSLEETIALYNITKDICSSLEEEKVFLNFCKQVDKYLRAGDCKFLKYPADIAEYKGYTVLPLDIDKDPIGYLAISHVREEDKEKLHILSQQFLLGMKRAMLYERVQELAITDSLTQVFSRRYLMERLNEEIGRSKKFKYNFSFLMLDIDNFKVYNDHYGHLVGDAVLKEAAGLIRQNIRQIDLVGRYGGEEFSIILAETGKEQVKFVAERIRQAIENKVIKVYDEELKVTTSIGISVYPDNASDTTGLIDTADQALYKAKARGKNRICMAGSV